MNTNKSNPVGTSINKKFTAFFLIESNKKTKAPTFDCFLKTEYFSIICLFTFCQFFQFFLKQKF